MSILASFSKPEACGQTVLPDKSLSIEQKLVENAKIQKFKCDILSNFQTMWSSRIPVQIVVKDYLHTEWEATKICKFEMLTGLSVPEFISVVMMPRTKSIVSCEIPWTWGQQRKVYASWTRSQNRWLSKREFKVFSKRSNWGPQGRENEVFDAPNALSSCMNYKLVSIPTINIEFPLLASEASNT